MRIHALEMPDDAADLAAWLEDQLVSFHLAELVAELSAGQLAAPPSESVQGVLGQQLGNVLQQGLTGLPPALVRELVRRPQVLLELQEQVLVQGGPYWDRKLTLGPGENAILERGRRRLAMLPAADPALRSAPLKIAWYRRPWLVSLATAAAVLLGVILYQQVSGPQPPPPAVTVAWGWARPGALPQDLPAGKYLGHLADAAAQWFKKRPETAVDLGRRIGEFRQGCTTLLLADHRPLAPDDRKWLLEKCRAWAGKLDKHLEAVESGQDPVQVRADTDKTVNKLIEALRTRAEEVGKRAAAIALPGSPWAVGPFGLVCFRNGVANAAATGPW